MSGKRCKALKREFRRLHKRAPRKAKLGYTDKSRGQLVTIQRSEWRQFKKGIGR